MFQVLVYLEMTEEKEFETSAKEEGKEAMATVQYVDEESLNGALVSNNWSPL